MGGALVLAVTQFGASFAGLLRDRALTQMFPGLGIVDVYIASFRVSDLLFQMTIMAGFSVALVPLLAQYHGRRDHRAISELLSGVLGMAAVVFGAVALGIAFLMPWLAPHVVQFRGESLQLYVTSARLALLTNFLFVFGNAFGQYLVTVQRYWVYGVTPILYTLGTIAGTLFLSSPDVFGPLGPMAGTVAGAVIYVAFRLLAAVRMGYVPHVRWWHADVPEFVRLMVPRMLALGALQLQLLLFDTVASGLSAGSVTINAYARNFQSVIVGVAGIALAQSAFSFLSQAAARGEYRRLWVYLRKGVRILLLVTVPGAVALVLAAPVAAALVHLTHRLEIFWFCLGLYALSIPFESMNHLLLRAFYALRNTVRPAVFSVVNGAVAIIFSWLLAPHMGVYALAVGFTIGQVIETIGLWVSLVFINKKLITKIDQHALLEHGEIPAS